MNRHCHNHQNASRIYVYDQGYYSSPDHKNQHHISPPHLVFFLLTFVLESCTWRLPIFLVLKTRKVHATTATDLPS